MTAAVRKDDVDYYDALAIRAGELMKLEDSKTFGVRSKQHYPRPSSGNASPKHNNQVMMI